MSDTFDASKLYAELTEDEGRKAFAYVDSRGNVTIGVGRNLTGKGLIDAEIDMLLFNDLAETQRDLDEVAPWWRSLPAPQQRVMLNLCFNMGAAGLASFKLFLTAMQRQDFATAAVQLQASAWWGEVGERGPRMVARLTGTADA